MNERIHVDRQALRQFIETMRRTARDMAAARDQATPAFTGNYENPATPTRWHGGVKVTLGVVNHNHPGRDAGEVLANRITNTVNYVVSIEEGSRAMGTAAEAVLNALDNQDSIGAAELEAIVARPGALPDDGSTMPYGGNTREV
ncbi:MAG: hypothetical protein ACRD0P_09015 [Stackebrandtia sp.]